MSDVSPYVVGIDLGTTHCAVAYVDTEIEAGEEGDGEVQVFAIPQLVRAGTTDDQTLLPSFLYLPGEHELADAQSELPFDSEQSSLIGVFARDQGTKVPDRGVHSSKSWLCHPGIDRRGAILPWDSDPAEVEKISPLEAQTRLLKYIRAAWDSTAEQDEHKLANQEVLLTVPASFDPTARELTVEAARAAGLTRVTLLEEPQAAFYAWLGAGGENWREQLTIGDLVLILDVGGGTTDLSLISVLEDEGNLTLERVAVGEHLLLGGDNMDLALAHVAAQRLKEEKGKDLNPWQARSLWQACRAAKEKLLTSDKKDTAAVTVLGRGSKLIGSSIKTELRREDLNTVLLEGFFPTCKREDGPAKRRAVGLAEIGLPFASDAGITRHVAAFLQAQDEVDGSVDGFAYPSAVLFNGGVFKGGVLRSRALEVLAGWAPKGHEPIRALDGEDLDLAVARGAAYYGLVRRGKGVRIRGGTARSYYVGIESSLPAVPGMPTPFKALCVAPFGLEEGTSAQVGEREFSLLVGEPAEFRFLGSTVRKEDTPGQLLDRWADEEIEELAPLEITIPVGEGQEAGSVMPVTLRSVVTEIGTLEVHCVGRDGVAHKLEWNVREQE
ncbi:MAG: Hsp70 family protein [Planctomycetes bacterium]|nr:Hsp70 family protein [Planctomycetota bacterium]